MQVQVVPLHEAGAFGYCNSKGEELQGAGFFRDVPAKDVPPVIGYQARGFSDMLFAI